MTFPVAELLNKLMRLDDKVYSVRAEAGEQHDALGMVIVFCQRLSGEGCFSQAECFFSQVYVWRRPGFLMPLEGPYLWYVSETFES